MRLRARRQALRRSIAEFAPMFTLVRRLFARDEGRGELAPLYRAVVAEARDPFWYVEGGVPDTIDGRFDMVAAVLSLVLIRLERAGEPGRHPGVMLTELFVDDMDGQLRQDGVGDVVVGKHVGRMMGALGGRLSAYRAAFDGEATLDEALRRNLYRGRPVDPRAEAAAAARLRALAESLAAAPLAALLSGRLSA
jgi:cytochrome b pre-mRNA-processing protein 3